MNYPFKYLVMICDESLYSESVSTFVFNDYADADKHYADAIKAGSKVFLYRIIRSDNLKL